MIKTNIELVEALKNVVANYKTLYIMGCFGAPMTDANKKRYTTNHTYNKSAARTAMINSATNDTFGFDCVCLIKGLLWGWCGDKTKVYGGASYASNGVPDVSADGMIAKCSNVSTTGWENMEIGEAVWLSGHIGIYAGNGVVIECSPSFKNCVQETACLNIKTIAGMNGRRWTKHGKLPYISYEKDNNTSTSNNTTPSNIADLSSTKYKISSDIKSIQTWLNTYYQSGLVVDGSFGPKSKAALIKAWQTEVGGLAVDGAFGPACKAAATCHNIKKGDSGILVTIWQAYLVANKYNPNGIDGNFGNGCHTATLAYQKSNGLTSDGIVGSNTWYKALH